MCHAAHPGKEYIFARKKVPSILFFSLDACYTLLRMSRSNKYENLIRNTTKEMLKHRPIMSTLIVIEILYRKEIGAYTLKSDEV